MPHLHRLAAALLVAAVAVGLLLPPAGRGGHVTAVRRAGAAAAVSAAGDGAATPGRGAGRGRRAVAPAVPAQAAPSSPPASSAPPAFDRARAAAAARAAGANELGQVPILMVHRVLAKPKSSLDRTPAQLYAEFTRLAQEGYVPVTAAEFVTGTMNVPAGRHPVVLTFDDGSPTHLAFDAAGAPEPDTAVGVIERVAREHPGFRPVATFFVNADPFALGDRAAAAMRWLAQHGFEVANHTTHHRDLAGMDHGAVAQEIGTDQKMITAATGIPPVTFAFPFGAPARLSWAGHGAAGGARWNFQGMFLAGWRPADSPFEKDYDPRQIPRIRDDGRVPQDDCRRFCSIAWLDWLARHPDKRFTSDGDPATVAFPQAKMIYLAKGLAARACPY
ncbi:polysaccharide deacetylase family protein [Actinoallomurus soli]|uniref:polysaccharide deacetylase family protein n=1 Tax=Actinoallomurus soli TaxID=2952535 RepID=UPI0020939567|nr:polysaccharide deacetylase family protein [Actinoallomurus soli]MCO5967348.1 polysaccharide deacetylase family protein [Actinoallomurus soli]